MRDLLTGLLDGLKRKRAQCPTYPCRDVAHRGHWKFATKDEAKISRLGEQEGSARDYARRAYLGAVMGIGTQETRLQGNWLTALNDMSFWL